MLKSTLVKIPVFKQISENESLYFQNQKKIVLNDNFMVSTITN